MDIQNIVMTKLFELFFSKFIKALKIDLELNAGVFFRKLGAIKLKNLTAAQCFLSMKIKYQTGI